MSSTWIGVGNAVIGSLLAWLLLGRRTKLMTQHIESRTMPDFFGTRFADQKLRVVASVIAFVFLIPYTAGVYKGISTLFEMGFGIPYEYCVIIMAILTAVYVILGGYKATAMNDFIQGIIMLFGILAVIIAVLNAQGGLVAAVDKLAVIPSDADPAVNGGFASWFGLTLGDCLEWWFLRRWARWDCHRWWVSSIASPTRVPSSAVRSSLLSSHSSWREDAISSGASDVCTSLS